MSKFGATIQIGAAYGNSACKPGSFRKSGSGVTIAELTQKQLLRGVHALTKQLETDIRAFTEHDDKRPKPYR